MTAAIPEYTDDIIEPWGERKVKRTLNRWWEIRDAQAGSGSNWGHLKAGKEERIAREFSCTVAYWVESTHRGMRQLFRDHRFGSRPIVESWLYVTHEAHEAFGKANTAQRQALGAGLLKDPVVRSQLDTLWRRAERCSTLAHKIERSRIFGIALGFLGAAFAMCAADDWAWRRLEEVE